jgi:hypothetical protein
VTTVGIDEAIIAAGFQQPVFYSAQDANHPIKQLLDLSLNNLYPKYCSTIFY